MALDDFQMPSFKDPDGTTYIWDSASKSYVVAPLTDKRPDQSHATGGDNDLFDPFQHTEQDGVPELEGYMASWAPGAGPNGQDHYFLDCPYCGSDSDYRESLLPADSGGKMYFCNKCGQYSDPNADAVPENPGWPADWAKASKEQPRCKGCGSTTVWNSGPNSGIHECAMCGNVWDDPEPDQQSLFSPREHKSTIDDPPFPAQHEVKCPNCGETTEEHVCPTCQKDLTPEWNVHGQDNEFFDAHPDYNDSKEWRTWPQNVPKKNEFNYDDSFPSMSLSKTAEALTDDWDDIFNETAPMRAEIGKWILDMHGQLHMAHGMSTTHPQIEQRDGLDPSQEIALGSVYNDGTADVQKVFVPNYFNLQAAQSLIEQAFGPVELQPPLGVAEPKGQVFAPFEIDGGQWFIPPNKNAAITGIAWVKERSNGVEYQPHMILLAEHLRDDDFMLYSQGSPCIITATGGSSSHAAYLAMTSNIPVIVGVGDSYNKVETGNYLKIEPGNETIAVIPGATGDMSSGQKQQIWDSILDFQRQRGGSVSQQPQFSHFHEELAWREANTPNLEDCPECSAPMMDQDGESVCHDCGHKQPIIHSAGAAALAVPELLGAGEAAGGAAGAGGGIGGIGGLMNGALGKGVMFQSGKNLVGGGGGGGQGGDSGPLAGPAAAAQAPMSFDPNAGTVSHRFAAENMRHQAFLGEIWTLIQNALRGIPWDNIGSAVAANPFDDALLAAGTGAAGAANQSAQNALPQSTGATTFGEEEVGESVKNDGTNSTDEASNSGIEGTKEHGDGPEQLKDVDGPGGSKGNSDQDDLGNQGDPDFQDKALKAFHMNLPLVIEFANSEEAGADNPILQALDSMLEQAFPGYKDGHDQENGATNEHPKEESESPEERDEDVDKPDQKSEGDDKKEIHIHTKVKEASVWHYAWGNPGDGYAEGYEDHPENFAQNYEDYQGGDRSIGDVIAAYPDGTIVLDDGITTWNMDRAREFAQIHGWSDQGTSEEMRDFGRSAKTAEWDPDSGYADHPEGASTGPGGAYICPNCETPTNDFGEGMWFGKCQRCGEDLIDNDGGIGDNLDDYDAYDGPGEYEMYGPDRPTMQEYYRNEAAVKGGVWHTAEWSIFSPPPESNQELEDMYAQRPRGWGQNEGWQAYQPQQQEAYSCQNCGEQSEFPASSDPRSLPSCPQCGARAWTHAGLPQTYANYETGSDIPAPAPAGAGGLGMQICPRCGQAHTVGSPCPVADVTTPLTTGDPQDMSGTPHVITKWHLAVPSNVPASQPQMGAGAPAAPQTCPMCGCNHIPGTPCPDYGGGNQMQQPAATGGQPANLATPVVGPGVQYSHTAADDAHHDDFDADPNPDAEYHSDDDWTDDAGTPLEEGAQYEMKSAASPIPDRVTIERILPEKLTYILHSGDVDFSDTITRDQLDLDGTTFSAVDFNDTGEDSMDDFSDQELPTRPGQDAIPQEDDLSVPSTVMSAVEPVTLDTYTGSFHGDAPDDRSWLLDGGSSAVEVDPVLMAKVAGKKFTPREEREFIDEAGEARNLDRLELSGTHYIDEELHTSDSMW